MVAHRFADEAAASAGRSDVIVIPPPCPVHVSPIDFSHTRELIECSEAATDDFLAERDTDVVPLTAESDARSMHRLSAA